MSRAASFKLAILYRLAVDIMLSLTFLPLDTFILIFLTLLRHFNPLYFQERRHRDSCLQTPYFYPKTILITGISTARGLKLARQFYYGGHRVIGADIGSPLVRSGGSMSNTISAYRSLPRKRSVYVSHLIDVIYREKVDLWIPYLDRITPHEIAMVKNTVESRTSCKCLHFNVDFVTLFNQNDALLEHMKRQGLPVAETKIVYSRDMIHQILNRSPKNAYLLRRIARASSSRDIVIALPKPTQSQTYAELSTINISKENPWVLIQRGRLGDFWADLILVQGHVKRIMIRPEKPIGDDSVIVSRLDETLRRLMDELAHKVGPRVSGHLSVKIMVDEEISSHSVCYDAYISGCRQGSAAVARLLDDRDLSSGLYKDYLEVLSSDGNAGLEKKVKSRGSAVSSKLENRFGRLTVFKLLHILLLLLLQIAEYIWGKVIRFSISIFTSTASVSRRKNPAFLEHSIFSTLDPLPWWWDYHVTHPLNSIVSLFETENEMSRQ